AHVPPSHHNSRKPSPLSPQSNFILPWWQSRANQKQAAIELQNITTSEQILRFLLISEMSKSEFDVYCDADTGKSSTRAPNPRFKKTLVNEKGTMRKNTNDMEVHSIKYLDKIKSKAQNPAQVSFGRKPLSDVSNTRGSISTRQRFNDSKTGRKASTLSSTMAASHISGKAFVGTQAFCTRGIGKSYSLKTESIRGSKASSSEHNNKGRLSESLSTDSRQVLVQICLAFALYMHKWKTVSEHAMQTRLETFISFAGLCIKIDIFVRLIFILLVLHERKSLPILRKVNLGYVVGEDWKANSGKKGGKCGLPIGRKGLSSVKCGGRSLLRNPATDGFSTLAQRIPPKSDSAESSIKLVEGKLITKPCQDASNIPTLKKVADQRYAEGMIAKQQRRETSQTDHVQVRIKSRKPIEATRKSLPVLKQVNLMGASQLKETAEKSGNVNTKIYKKMCPPISNARSHLWRKRASDGFVSMASRSQVKVDARYLMRKSVKPIMKAEVKISNRPDTSSSNKPISVVAISKNEEANTSSLSQTTACEHSEKGFPYEKCNLDTRSSHSSSRRKSNRRRSYTSLLMASSKILEEQGEPMKLERLPSIDDKCNHLEVAEYVDEIYFYYWVTEAQNPSLENYMVIQTDITPQMRGILINWLIEVHFKFDLMQETLYLLVTLLDQYLSMVAVKKNELQLVGLTTLLLASKYEDGWPPKVMDLISISAESYTRNQMLKMNYSFSVATNLSFLLGSKNVLHGFIQENVILKRLKFRLNTPTPYVFMLRFLKAAQLDTKHKHLALYLLELCLVEYEALKFKPSLLSACAIYVARCTLQLAPAWTSLLSRHTHYEEPKLREGAEMILGFQRVAGTGLLNVTYEKYLNADLSCVAKIRPLDRLPL
ncbi:Cyclin, C-terminal domain, partial [Dillenia turbinata]